MRTYTTIMIAALLLTTACASDEEPRLGQVNATMVNTPVYLYIEDADGHDLLAAGPTVSVRQEETYEQLPYNIMSASEQYLPWGGRGTLLSFVPAGPYHYPLDEDYIYTLNPTTVVTVDDSVQIRLQRQFNYDLRRYDMGRGEIGVDIDYTVGRTQLESVQLQSDTAHVIVENGIPWLRTEGQRLMVEMRLPAVSDSLAALTPVQDEEGVWHVGNLMQFRLLFSGRSIARPYEHLTLDNCTERTQDASGAWHDDRFLSLKVSLQQPYLNNGNSYNNLSNGLYTYLLTAPALLDGDYEHSVEVEVYGYAYSPKLTLTSLHVDYMWVDEDVADPEHIVVDWRKILNY
ncbi:MAG: hypothetical protein IJ570_07875 [Prevotella sp.]|nr:hypothetical protein [Prevotella sp.]